MTIDCFECGGSGETGCGHASHHIDTMSACDMGCTNGVIECSLCEGLGKISVYTEAEKTQAVIDELERLTNMFSPDGWFFPVLNTIKCRIIALKQSMKE